MPWIGLYFVKLLLSTGIEVYRYTPKILHAKFIMIDNWLSIGSMNLNHRSFYLDVETNVVLSLKSTLSEASEGFERLVSDSQRVGAVDVKNKNPLLVLWIRFALLMKGWM